MQELSVECPIHLGDVPLKEIKVYKCGHGFCATCIIDFFDACRRAKPCPVCRQSIKSTDAVSLYLNPPRGSTQRPKLSLSSQVDIDLISLDDVQEDKTGVSMNEFKEKARKLATEVRHLGSRLKAAQQQVDSSNEENEILRGDNEDAQAEIKKLSERSDAQTRDYAKLKHRCSVLERDLALSKTKFGELEPSHKALVATNKQLTAQTKEDKQRISNFQDWSDGYKKEIARYKAKVKGLVQKNKQLALVLAPHRHQQNPEESLIVTDRNTDHFEYDHKSLNQIIDNDQESSASVSDDELILAPHKPVRGRLLIKNRSHNSTDVENDDEDRPQPSDRPLARFPTDWNLNVEGNAAQASLEPTHSKKRRRADGVVIGASSAARKIIKVDLSGSVKRKNTATDETRSVQRTAVSSHKQRSWLKAAPPIALDRNGRVKGIVALGSRERMNKSS
ncbi:hypothetical protein BJ138DRAFT_345767 [Hygrophoropsis aurantiaca]|uniref:Uncharacterized protein n=1 Tax=Hygrophoropsis aurantiaca TaxID=72124 RepID=A0ACB8ANT2_9AGAM|nr:hypothetical protein BJ138DRAFT_345767 [Hygrophoropsis aurantiaca]